jgi:large subunit ribosomal protein L3
VSLGLLGNKIGMTQIFDQLGNIVPVTVIKVGPCVITQIKTLLQDGYDAIQVGYGIVPINSLTQSQLGHLQKSTIQPLKYLNRGPMTHGSKNHRAPGSIGMGTTPGRVLPGKRMSGQLGSKNSTVKKLKIIQVNVTENILVIKGSVPGKIGNLLSIKPSN